MLYASDGTYVASVPGWVSERKPLPARLTRRPPATRRPLVVLLLDLDVLTQFLCGAPLVRSGDWKDENGTGQGVLLW